MTWKNILKAELPPKPEAGSPVTNEQRQAQDAWANEYVNKIVQYLNEIGDTMNSSWCSIDPQARTVSWNLTSGSKKYTFEQFANELKSLLRAVVYGQFNQTNYAFSEQMYLKDHQRYVRDMMRNSTASNVFTNYMRK